MLPHNSNGSCIYLGERGCTIWHKAPHLCKIFDCRLAFTSRSRNERREMVKQRLVSVEVLEAGRKRRHTL